ncbi:MotE family protein [Roseibium aestuarii]|uniref:MotE family protein n=1 Tax=Roseibium aestuarii TaxID=2600299 RepID=A0ABW4JW86_9HYPH|nr:MotE family protein [Roseibium aestuarii]
MPNFRPARSGVRVMLAGSVLLMIAGQGAQAEQPRAKPQSDPAPKLVRTTPETQGAEQPSDVELYCKNIAQSAEEARIAWQTWKLLSLETKVQAQVALLERKRAEFEQWVEKRAKLLAEVEGHVVNIVSRMRPDAAAAQLSTTDDDTATGVLLKLKPRVASEILDEMDPARAAQLTQAMVGFSDPAGKGGM